MSLRRRLLLGLLLIGSVLVVTNATISRRFESVLLERIDRQLVDTVSRPIFQEARGPRPRRGLEVSEQTLSEYYIAVGNPRTGALVEVPSAFADETTPRPSLDVDEIAAHLSDTGRAEPFTVEALSGDGQWRLVAIPTGGATVAVVGVTLDEVSDTMARVRFVQVLGTVAVLATLGLVTWWVVRLGLQPIEEMARTADAIVGSEVGDLSRRVDHPSAGTEAGRLGVAFNEMLQRIEVSFKEREASEERVRRFAADASHELRTPLTSILGYAELWRAGGLREKGALADAMQRTEQEGRRMAALVEDLLLLARLDQRRAPARVAVRLDELAADAVRDAGAVEPDRPVSLDAQPAVVEGDEGQLRQVLGNLLTNARVHTPPGTPVHVRVRSAAGTNGGRRAQLEVADEGPGMAPDVAAHVFDRFFRADPSRARAAGGTGLGLAIVEAIVTGHGGGVRVDSAPGRGSRFVVDLPAT